MYWVVIGLGIVLFAAFVLLISRKATSPGVDPTQLTFDPAVMEEVRALTAGGKKIQAIKLLRERTPGLSLATGKLIVDRLENSLNRPLNRPRPPVDGFRPEQTRSQSLDDAPSSSLVPLDIELEVRSLKAQGQLIPAIKLVREQTGLQLEEAKDYVDRL